MILSLVLACTTTSQPEPVTVEHSAPVEATAPKTSPRSSLIPATTPTYDQELERVDKLVGFYRRRAEAAPNSWMARQHLADTLSERARLTGDYDDFSAAEAALEEAFSIAKPGAGPWMSAAQLSYSLHRNERASAALSKAHPSTAKTGLEGSLAFQSGDYERARQLWQDVDARKPSYTNDLRLANLHWKLGDFATAEPLVDKAESRYHGRSARVRAHFHLIRGLMDLDRGNLDAAMAHYRDAETQLSGWYLIDEHVAEILAEKGQHEQAQAAYVELVERTGNPEFMDALAELTAETDPEASLAWVAKARAAYEQRLDTFPEATAGHALDHFLAFEPDANKVVALAEANYTARQNGDAKLGLAAAYRKAGRTADADRLEAEVARTGWRASP